jgi:hypothetical protein
VLLALAALFAWTAWQNAALRGRVAALEQENRSLAQALRARAAAASQPATPAAASVVAAGPLPFPPPKAAAAAPHPASSLPRPGPLEEAFQRQREAVPGPGTSPFGRP